MAVEIDGKIIRSLPEQVSKNMEDNERQDNKLTELERKLDAAISGVLHYKGSVATYADLPADAEVGDVYNVIDTGANYAWTGSEWDEFGSTVDLSGYVQKAVNEIITGKYDFENGFYIDSQGCEIKPDQHGFMVESYSDPGRRLAITTDGIVGNDNQDLGSSAYTWNALYAEQIIPSTNLTIGKAYNSVLVDSFFVPKRDNQYDIGNLSYKWKNLYLNGSINPNASGYGFSLPSSASFTANSELVDSVSNQTITGDKTFESKIIIKTRDDYKWTLTTGAGGAALFINRGTSERYKFYDGYFAGSGLDLGSSSIKWADLYLSGAGYISTIDSGTSNLNLKCNGIIKLSAQEYAIYFYQKICASGDNILDIGQSNVRFKDLYLAGNLNDGTNSVNIADLKALIDYAKAQGWIS